MPDKTILFLHIPKTAGTTLNRIIEHQYQPEEIFSAGPTPAQPHGGLEGFKRLDAARRARIRLLRGHLPFGVHEFVPGSSTYFTVLRDPTERVLSFYYFVRRFPANALHDQVNAAGMSVQQFLDSRISLETDNFQTRAISGAWHHAPYGQCTEEMLEQAKRNLRERFAVVGLAERFDETLLLLKRAFHWRNIFYVKLNVTRRRPRQTEFSAETLRLIARHNRLDFELHRYARELFADQVRQDAAFVERLRTFRARNRLLQPLLHVQWRLRKDSLRALVRKALALSL